MTIEGYTYTISHALGGLFLPKVTRLTTDNDSIIKIENLLIKVGRIQLFIIALIIIGFALMGQEFVYLWMGTAFKESYYVAFLLILPGFITLTQEIAYTALVALNEIKYRAVASIITAIISMTLSLYLSSMLGAIGSAMAIFIGNIIGQVIFINIIYQRVLKINMFRFYKECHLKMLPSIILSLAVGIILQYTFQVSSLMLFIIKIFILATAYFVFMWMFSLNSFEKKLILGLFGKR